MKRTMIALLCLITLGIVGNTHADIVANLIVDGGFEGLDATTPSTVSSPWFTDETVNYELQREETFVNSGSQAVVWQYYGEQPYLMQNMGAVIEAGKDYEVSFWHALAEPSGNVNHVNAPRLSVALFVSDTVDGTYTYAFSKFGIEADQTDGTYENYTGIYDATDLSAHVGKYMRLRFAKPNDNVTHRIFVDDVSFGQVIPEPATIGLIAMVGTGLLAVRRFMVL